LSLSAIIPVKTFSKAKTRLKLSQDVREELCKIMLSEVLQTVYNSSMIDKIVVVSKDEHVFHQCKKFNVIEIIDETEESVNNAVSLGQKYLKNNDIDASIVFPQDIPFITTQDIDYLFNFTSQNCVLIVPSKRFDGTNALFRSPINIMKTHYDDNSFYNHLKSAKIHTKNFSPVFIRRMMFDIDNMYDLEFALKQNETEFTKKIQYLI